MWVFSIYENCENLIIEYEMKIVYAFIYINIRSLVYYFVCKCIKGRSCWVWLWGYITMKDVLEREGVWKSLILIFHLPFIQF